MIELRETFSTTMVIEDVILPNTFSIVVNLVVNNQKNKFYNKAMDRVQYYISEILDNSIFIGSHNLKQISELPFKAQVHVFPDDPWDHLIAMCLYTKLNSICEEVFFVDSISISSNQAQNVSHHFSEVDGGSQNLIDIFDDDPDNQEFIKYWYKPQPQLFLLHEGLKLTDHTWADVEMEYEEKKNLPDELGTVVTLKDFQKAKAKPKDNDDDNTA